MRNKTTATPTKQRTKSKIPIFEAFPLPSLLRLKIQYFKRDGKYWIGARLERIFSYSSNIINLLNAFDSIVFIAKREENYMGFLLKIQYNKFHL